MELVGKIGGILGIVLVATILVMVLIRFGLLLYIKFGGKGAIKCSKCKGEMIHSKSYLYVIPARFGEEHKQCAEYYLQNAVLIEDESQIPTGHQSCYMHILQCQNCGYKEVQVIDFLKVRDTEMIQDSEKYPYETFREFLEK